jgi:hypothetical protein
MINVAELQLLAKHKKYTIKEFAVVLLFVAGIFISLMQFLYNRSLWIDEALLALNIIHKNGFELLKPLDHRQVAPILFLQIEKLFSMFIPAEYGLRIFPLVCFWLFLYFFYKIVKIISRNNYYAIIIALFFVVFNPLFILYSTEVKQYIIDALVLSVIFYFTIKDYQWEQNKYYILAIVGSLSIFLSNVTPIILFTSGLYLFYDNFFVTKNKKIHSLSLMTLTWLVTFSVYYYFFIYEHPLREYMIDYWSQTQGFLLLSFNEPMRQFVVRLGCIFLYNKTFLIKDASIPSLIMYFIMIILCLVGIINLIRHKKIKIILLTCVPFVLHLFLSIFQLYPVSTRTMLYTLPCVILICAEGFNSMAVFSRLKSRKKKSAIIAIGILFLFCGLYSLPIEREEIKNSLKYINENIKEGEKIHVYRDAIPAFQYYVDIEYTNVEFVKHTQVVYDNSKSDIKKYVNGLTDLQGKYWLLFSHVYSWDETDIINQMDSFGYKKTDEFRSETSFTYLYDLGK